MRNGRRERFEPFIGSLDGLVDAQTTYLGVGVEFGHGNRESITPDGWRSKFAHCTIKFDVGSLGLESCYKRGGVGRRTIVDYDVWYPEATLDLTKCPLNGLRLEGIHSYRKVAFL